MAFGFLVGSAAKAALGVGKFAVGGGAVQRAAAGAIGYGGYTFATSDANNFTNRVEETVKAASLGAVGGLALSRGNKMLGGAAGSMWKNKGTLAKNLWKTGKASVSFGTKAAQFTLNNPTLALGGAAALGGGYMAMSEEEKSPTMEGAEMDLSMNAMAAQYQAGQDMFAGAIKPQAAVMPMAQYQQMANSTHGLVQGLHRGRHG